MTELKYVKNYILMIILIMDIPNDVQFSLIKFRNIYVYHVCCNNKGS